MDAWFAQVASHAPSIAQQYGSSAQTSAQHDSSEQKGVVFGAQQLLLLVPQAAGGGAFGVSRSWPAPLKKTAACRVRMLKCRKVSARAWRVNCMTNSVSI
jgi:hypothetical protein